MALNKCRSKLVAGSTMKCERCDMYWDANEPYPPSCKTSDEIAAAAFIKMNDMLRNDAIQRAQRSMDRRAEIIKNMRY